MDAKIRILDASGRPVPGVKVSVEQTSHDFLFGCNIYMFDRYRNEAQNAAYKQRFAELFNYATLAVLENPELPCQVIPVHPIVAIRGNPLVTVVDPLPVPTTNYGLNFAAQLVELRVDFHPGNQFQLPAELSPPLKKQRLAIHLSFPAANAFARKDPCACSPSRSSCSPSQPRRPLSSRSASTSTTRSPSSRRS